MSRIVTLIVFVAGCIAADEHSKEEHATQVSQARQESVVCGTTLCYPYTAWVSQGILVDGIDPAADSACNTGCDGGGHCSTDWDEGGPHSVGLANLVAVAQGLYTDPYQQAVYIETQGGTCESTYVP